MGTPASPACVSTDAFGWAMAGGKGQARGDKTRRYTARAPAGQIKSTARIMLTSTA